MNLPRIFAVLVWFVSAGRPLCVLADYQVGETVVVIHDASIKVEDKIVQQVPRGTGLKVHDIQGNWLWVTNEGAGWINRRDVASPTEAIEIFTEDIKKDHFDSDAYIRRGLAWFDKQDVDLAIADLNEAIRLDPRNASAYSSRAICWWARREVDKAISDDTDAIRLAPREPMYLANRGILWNMKGEADKAIADADAALSLNPNFVTAHLVRGKALVHKRDYSGAIKEFDKALQTNPRGATLYGLRGRALAENGEYDRAVQDLNRAVILDPNDKNACNEIARFYAACPDARYRNGAKAVEYARRACELTHWRWASAISVLAASYAESRNFEQAVTWQEKAVGMVEGKRRDEFQAHLELYKAHKPLRLAVQSSNGGRR